MRRRRGRALVRCLMPSGTLSGTFTIPGKESEEKANILKSLPNQEVRGHQISVRFTTLRLTPIEGVCWKASVRSVRGSNRMLNYNYNS